MAKLEGQAKSNSSYQKQITRLTDKYTALHEANLLRKYQISQFHNLINKLLKEGRITKAELAEFIVKKRVVKSKKK